jgi:hypothetical protein
MDWAVAPHLRAPHTQFFLRGGFPQLPDFYRLCRRLTGNIGTIPFRDRAGKWGIP